MKKLLALLLALIMVLSLVACGAKEEAGAETPEAETPAADTAATEEAGASDTEVAQAEKTNEEAITVTYFFTAGNYLDVFTAEVDKWNAGEGADKGVYLEVTCNINDGSAAAELQMQAGNHFDIMDGCTNAEWILQGWVQDLWAIENEELQAHIAAKEQYFVPGLEVKYDQLNCLPLEVVPLKFAVNTDLFEASALELPETFDDVVAAAQKITEDNPGTAWGYGGTTWSAFYRRLHMKHMSSSIETPWWDPNTGTYSFGQYEPVMSAIKTMYENGWILGMDDLAIDPIRAEFAAGKVGMFPAPGYDWAVYTNQFPATCNFAFIDMPTITEEEEYMGMYLDRVTPGIDKVQFEAADDAKKQAIVDAYLFITGDYLKSVIYANGGLIPYEMDIIEATELVITENAEQWAQVSDLTNLSSMLLFPDNIIPLEGDTYQTVLNAYVHGEYEWDEAIPDLEERYNAAWAEAVEDPDIDTSIYLYDYNHDLP